MNQLDKLRETLSLFFGRKKKNNRFAAWRITPVDEKEFNTLLVIPEVYPGVQWWREPSGVGYFVELLVPANRKNETIKKHTNRECFFFF